MNADIRCSIAVDCGDRIRAPFWEAAGVRVVTGAVEAAALGNALLQGLSLGRFASLEAGRAWAAAAESAATG
jgi:hypothetical protein